MLTSEPVYTPDQAWKIILIYASRWQIEMALRFSKCELGLESLYVFSWEIRQCLFLILTLVHAFLLRFLTPNFAALRDYLLKRCVIETVNGAVSFWLCSIVCVSH